jgi:hypothetical protein
MLVADQLSRYYPPAVPAADQLWQLHCLSAVPGADHPGHLCAPEIVLAAIAALHIAYNTEHDE